MSEIAEEEDRSGHLRELSDPDFFARWAQTRYRLFTIPREDPEHPEVRREYSAMVAEYRKRMDGALASSAACRNGSVTREGRL
jgi:hypothetical protein